MNQAEIDEIIAAIEKDLERLDTCSLRQVTASLLYSELSLFQLKKLAKHIVKEKPYVTEIKGNDVLVSKNEEFAGPQGSEDERYSNLKHLIWLVAAAVTYLIFQVFLPNLKK